MDKKTSKEKGFGVTQQNAMIRLREQRQRQGMLTGLLEQKTARGKWVVHMGSKHAEIVEKRWLPLFNKFRPEQPYYRIHFAAKQVAECMVLAFLLTAPVTQMVSVAVIYLFWTGYIWRHMPLLEQVMVNLREGDR